MEKKVEFAAANLGYNQQQVDAYVETLIREYSALHEAYTLLTGKLAAIENDKKTLNGLLLAANNEITLLKQERDSLPGTPVQVPGAAVPTPEMVGRALVDAEALAAQIVEKADREAEELKASAKNELTRIFEERSRAISELAALVDRLQTFVSEADQP
ncbi:MAG: DivIVA domain-containing protein [Oscillospiraceae bacterium]|nr:DivIVA domain-containing protein [Oscillospiraceae bacterium]